MLDERPQRFTGKEYRTGLDGLNGRHSSWSWLEDPRARVGTLRVCGVVPSSALRLRLDYTILSMIEEVVEANRNINIRVACHATGNAK